MLKWFFILLCLCYSIAYGATQREDITSLKKQRVTLAHEHKRLLTEVDAIGKMIEDLALLSKEEKETLAAYQVQISKTLPLLVRLERSNPLRMIIDPTMGQEKMRGIILTRFLISSIKRKMHHVQEHINDIKMTTNDLAIKSQSTHELIQAIEIQEAQLALVEDKKVIDWIKAESERIGKEEDLNTLLEESHATISKTTRSISAAAASKGLPFHRLGRPVRGKIFKDSALQNRFSSHTQGIFFETQKNAQVCAPAKGKIAFRGPFRNHAEILIIDHGGKAHTILMGMDKIDAEIGKNVYAGQKLGTMAGYGSGPPYLYLELRHKGQFIDPTPYFVTKKWE